MKKPSVRRKVENELVFRQLNEQVQKEVAKTNHIAKEEGYRTKPIPEKTELQFFCECSDDKCTQRLGLSLEKYAKIHRQRDHFVVKPGHENTSVEEVVNKRPGYLEVKKYISALQTLA